MKSAPPFCTPATLNHASGDKAGVGAFVPRREQSTRRPPSGATLVRPIDALRTVLHPSTCPICWPELFGLVTIEAMACGTPVIALAHGSAPEVVDPSVSGLVVTA
ncbi:glycosyltransferase [Bradyrhizobium diazoefficiens]|nr:glycosyltransferase [Bradyrhizobium diazoefficiens]